MSNNNADQPAYPIVETGAIGENVTTGLTKRELLAGMAMQGICAGMDHSGIVANRATDTNGIVELAVLYADALLNQLSK